MAIYRLSVQTIRRGDGRSVVAAAAYRAGAALHDSRLEMTFDFRRKEGVEHREVMGPAQTPPALLEREGLWNAAEKADRRKDSVPAQEVLISLPHELNAEQRRELVRTFVTDSLVKRGMIADFAIHQPDPQGDQRNFHAHILVTTRDVGPDGFGKKNPDWNHASFVSDLRHEWSRVLNRELQRHLGPEAPQVSELSLADQGVERAPSPKKGPAATAMERRGEASELGARHAGVQARTADIDAQEREVRRQMRPENTPWTARPTRELFSEMESIVAAMERDKSQLLERRKTLGAPRPPSKKQIENSLTRQEVSERKRADLALKRAHEQARSSGLSARSIARWLVDPGGAFMSTVMDAHRQLDRLAEAERAANKANRALAEKRAWVRSEAGQAVVANVLEPAVAASVEAAKERRTLDRRVKRLDARIRSANRVIVDLGVAQELGVDRIKTPSKIVRDGRREAGQARHIAAIGGPVRGLVAAMPKSRVDGAMRSIALRAISPIAPERSQDLGPDLDPDR